MRFKIFLVLPHFPYLPGVSRYINLLDGMRIWLVVPGTCFRFLIWIRQPGRVALWFLVICLFGGMSFRTALAQTPTASAPDGFRLIDSGLGVQLFTKDYPGGSPDFVQVVDLSQGARLELMHGDITELRPTKGSFGGPDPRMTSPALQTYWQRTSSDPYAFCVTNGSFFYMPEYPTRLAFPLKVDGKMITEGWGIQTYPEQKLILEIWKDRADIQPLSQEVLHRSTAPDIIGGLTEDANKRAKYAVGRTFVGVDDRDQDGIRETIFILNTQTASQNSAAAVLRSFGADQVMMLDGGGSTQLLCKSGWHIRSDRPIPQAIAIYAAKPPPIATHLLDKPNWPVLVAGEGFPLELSIQNSGTISWTAQTTQFILDAKRVGDTAHSPLSVETLLPMPEKVRPGETTVLSDTLSAFIHPGIYTVQIEWGVHYDEKTYEGEPIHTQVIVLPSSMEGQRLDLQTLVEKWKAEQPDRVGSLATQWIEEHGTSVLTGIEGLSPSSNEGTHADDAIWIPLLMLPIVVILGVVVARINRRE